MVRSTGAEDTGCSSLLVVCTLLLSTALTSLDDILFSPLMISSTLMFSVSIIFRASGVMRTCDRSSEDFALDLSDVSFASFISLSAPDGASFLSSLTSALSSFSSVSFFSDSIFLSTSSASDSSSSSGTSTDVSILQATVSTFTVSPSCTSISIFPAWGAMSGRVALSDSISANSWSLCTRSPVLTVHVANSTSVIDSPGDGTLTSMIISFIVNLSYDFNYYSCNA